MVKWGEFLSLFIADEDCHKNINNLSCSKRR